jgi:tetratricopeptide (TPR) repeat protein
LRATVDAGGRTLERNERTEPDLKGASESAWVAAASAMRMGDYEAAERAFNALATNPDAHTRDAARLARAQVWLAQGRRAEALRELQNLARAGATTLVRERAAEALEDLR